MSGRAGNDIGRGKFRPAGGIRDGQKSPQLKGGRRGGEMRLVGTLSVISPYQNVMNKVQNQAASILDGIVSMLPQQTAHEEESGPLDGLLENLHESLNHLGAHFAIGQSLAIGHRTESLEALLDRIVQEIADAEGQMVEVKGFLKNLAPGSKMVEDLIPEKTARIRAYLDFLKVETRLNELEGTYISLMRKILTQHPLSAQIGKYLADHLYYLEKIEYWFKSTDALKASFAFGYDLGSGDYQGAAVEGTLAVLAAVLILCMAPEIFIIIFFAEPYLKFVESSIKKGRPYWETYAIEHGANLDAPLPNWEDYLRQHLQNSAN